MRRGRCTVKAKHPQVKRPLRPLHPAGTLAILTSLSFQAVHCEGDVCIEPSSLGTANWPYSTLFPQSKERVEMPTFKDTAYLLNSNPFPRC